jgi:hypothetical protein
MSIRRKGRKFSPLSTEHKDRLSKANKGKKMSEEQKRKLSEAKFGTKLTNEHKEKIRISGIGRVQTKETIDKRVKANTGMKRTQEQNKNNADAQKKRFAETPVSIETRKKLSENSKRMWEERKLKKE